MKRLILLFIFIGATQLSAGCNESKPSREYSKIPSESHEQETPEPSGKPKPFEGKHWKAVHIANDHSIYSFDGESLKNWDFGGFESTDCNYNSQDMSEDVYAAYFTDDYCYLEGEDKTVLQYPMNGGSQHKKFVMKEMIRAFEISEAGFAMLTEGGFITYFDSEGEPIADPIELDSSEGRTLGLLDSGELLRKKSGKIEIIHPQDQKKEFATPLAYEEVFQKKTLSGHIILVREHETIQNRSCLDFFDVENEKTVFSIQTLYPKILDLDGNTLATSGNDNNEPKIKLYDTTTGKKTYEGCTEGIGGICALRLEGDTVYFVGDKPNPKSIIIDTRQKPNQE